AENARSTSKYLIILVISDNDNGLNAENILWLQIDVTHLSLRICTSVAHSCLFRPLTKNFIIAFKPSN
ncbi:MAG: hypothetical protein ACPG5W_03170, partial [Flavobacteriales bacterium]